MSASPPATKKPRLDPLSEPVDASSSGVNLTLEQEAQKPSKKKKRREKHVIPEPCSPEDVLWHDVVLVLGQEVVDEAIKGGEEWEAPFEVEEEVDLMVHSVSSGGDAICKPVGESARKPWVVVVPLALPGEIVRARVHRHARLHSIATLLDVKTPNPEYRDDSRAKCKYFGQCGGCQYQMLSYETQLGFKQEVVTKAYRNFSGLPPSALPEVLSTIPSPLEYAYRTKITPHFDVPFAKRRKARHGDGEPVMGKPGWLNIGFNEVGARHVVDIEECPIATPSVNAELDTLRKKIHETIHTYKRGATLILRDTLLAWPEPPDALDPPHAVVTDHKSLVRELVDGRRFEYTAGSFFQNNNAVLTPLTNYVRDALVPSDPPLTHLVDAYCGAGLFAITLAPHFMSVAGIELSADSIACATKNAALNDLPADRCFFRAGDAADIFASVADFPPARSAVVIDPPRKGCDAKFLRQLVRFGAARIVYVSCNVHTQARDVGIILGAEVGDEKRYALESVRGFDLFPQTAHVESVAVMRLV